MPEPIDATTILTELGDKYKDSKALEGVSDSTMLAKRFIDTQSKLGQRLEGVIQKPGKDATDEEKAQYETTLKKELGAPESIDAYESDPVEGVSRPDEMTTFIKQTFLEEGIAVGSYSRIMNKLDTYRLQAQNQAILDENQKFIAESEKFKSTHSGDKLTTGTRTALKAMLQFAGSEEKDLTDAIKASKILDNPGNLDALRKLGIWPSTIERWERIGGLVKSDLAITNEGSPVAAGSKAAAAGTVEGLISSVYTHPSSVKDRASRGKTY